MEFEQIGDYSIVLAPEYYFWKSEENENGKEIYKFLNKFSYSLYYINPQLKTNFNNISTIPHTV